MEFLKWYCSLSSEWMFIFAELSALILGVVIGTIVSYIEKKRNKISR